MSSIIVLHVTFRGHLPGADLSSLLARLPYAKRLELERRSDGDRASSLAGIALALEAARRVGGVSVALADLRFPQEGKPELGNGTSFSISHGAGCIACAASGDLECGLDVEATSDDAGAGEHSRLACWTAKEATLKAAGFGLREASAIELSCDLRFGVIRGRRYYLTRLDLGPSVVAHLAASGPADQIRVERVLRVPVPPGP